MSAFRHLAMTVALTAAGLGTTAVQPASAEVNIWRTGYAGSVDPGAGMLYDQIRISLLPSHNSKQVAFRFLPPQGYKVCYFTYGKSSDNGRGQFIRFTDQSSDGVSIYQAVGCASGNIPNELVAPLVTAGAAAAGVALSPVGAIAATHMAYELGDAGSCGAFGERSFLEVEYTILVAPRNEECRAGWPNPISRGPEFFHWEPVY